MEKRNEKRRHQRKETWKNQRKTVEAYAAQTRAEESMRKIVPQFEVVKEWKYLTTILW